MMTTIITVLFLLSSLQQAAVLLRLTSMLDRMYK